MDSMSRRHFLFALSASLAWVSPYHVALASRDPGNPEKEKLLSITMDVLVSAYEGEMVARRNYIAYCQEALTRKYPNLAYLFKAFAASEGIHADNFKRVLEGIHCGVEEPVSNVVVSDTQANLNTAATNELKKIEETYPGFLNRLRIESHDEAVVSCMYAWKSHKQHEAKIAEIKRYARFFFGSVAKRVEGLKFDFHVCEICGATMDVPPKTPCDICNYPVSHFHRIERPV